MSVKTGFIPAPLHQLIITCGYPLQAKTTVTVNGNVFSKVMKFPEGTIKVTREFTDNELVIVRIVDIAIYLYLVYFVGKKMSEYEYDGW